MQDAASPDVLIERPTQDVAVVKIARPERRNALNIAVKSQIADHVAELDELPEVKAIIICGEGVFAAGTDVAEMVDLTPTDHTLRVTDRMFTVLRQCATPLIAAVEGYALGGGCELAMSCDLIVAGRGAKFGQPEIRVGVMPGAGGTQRLLRTIGRYQTLHLLLLGGQLDVDAAYAAGLVSEVTAEGQSLSRSLEIASMIAEAPQLAIRAILDLVDQGADIPLSTALLLERKAFQLLFDTHDQKEGMRAFLEKRTPRFEGR